VGGKLALRLATLLLAAAYLWLGTRPRLVRPMSWFPDWVGHGAAYALLAVTLGRAWPQLPQAGVVAVATAHGGLVEWLQLSVPGRSGEVKDLLADFFGSWLGLLLWGRKP
jgi:VanZ family protein